MAMNRQTKRMLQKQGQLGADGEPVAQKRQRQAPPPQKNRDQRVGPVQFFREVRGELRKVAWPTRAEVINYSIVVLVTVVMLTALIFGLDYVFGEGVLRLLKAD
jgi:preprotein translocase subunit SecE